MSNNLSQEEEKRIGNLFGVDVLESPFVPDGEVYVMNKKMLNSFAITNTIPLTRWEKIKKYFSRLWLALKGKL